MDLKNTTNINTYQIDQENLDDRGIPMTIDEVINLSTTQYTHRIKNLNLNEDDMMFVKGLRRRLKNRMASQNCRRRTLERIRRLAAELAAARRRARSVRRARERLAAERAALRDLCRRLHAHICQQLNMNSLDYALFTEEVVQSEVISTRVEEEVKRERVGGARRAHGRKQAAPRKICCYDYEDAVLDLKIKKTAEGE